MVGKIYIPILLKFVSQQSGFAFFGAYDFGCAHFFILQTTEEKTIMEEINLGNQTNQPTHPNSNKKIIGIVICIAVFVVILAIIISSPGGTKTYLTYENYMKIQTGMTYGEVVKILNDHQGDLDTSASYGGYTLSYYTWTNSSGTRCIVVGFENGKVCTKSQYGLN